MGKRTVLRRGRPRRFGEKTVQLSVIMTEREHEILRILAARQHRSRGCQVRHWIATIGADVDPNPKFAAKYAEAACEETPSPVVALPDPAQHNDDQEA